MKVHHQANHPEAHLRDDITDTMTVTSPPVASNDIVNQFLYGPLSPRSRADLDLALDLCPDEPFIYKLLGHVLHEKGEKQAAYQQYEKACQLYIKKGMGLQAMAARLSAWILKNPSGQQAKQFYSELRTIPTGQKPGAVFISSLSFKEFLALTMVLTPVQVETDRIIQKFGANNNLFLVISGELLETQYIISDDANKKIINRKLIADDWFGNLDPLSGEQISTSFTKTTSHVELLKVHQSKLAAISQEYENLKNLFHSLGKPLSLPTNGAEKRRSQRYTVSTKAELKIYQEKSSKQALIVTGFTNSISIDGVMVTIHDRLRIGTPKNLPGKLVKIRLSLPDQPEFPYFLGRIAWSTRVEQNDKKPIDIGIQFQYISTKDRDLLQRFCSNGEGEQNLLFSLWESTVKDKALTYEPK